MPHFSIHLYGYYCFRYYFYCLRAKGDGGKWYWQRGDLNFPFGPLPFASKRKYFMKFSLLPSLIFLFIIVISGCAKDHREDLGGGYSYFSSNPYNHSISMNRKVVVYTNVVECRRVGDYILGKRIPSARPDVSEEFLAEQEYGHFLININTGELTDGLTEIGMKELLSNISN